MIIEPDEDGEEDINASQLFENMLVEFNMMHQ